MQKIWQRLKKELLEVIPPTIFFFVAFNVIVFTKHLMLEEYGIPFSGFISATIGALIVGKVVLIADEIPFINKFPGKPLIYNVAWKTLIYIVVATIVRYVEFFIPLWRKYGSFSPATEHLWDEIVWPQFWAVHILLLCLFFLYVSFRELARTLGEQKFLQVFFGIQVSAKPQQPE